MALIDDSILEDAQNLLDETVDLRRRLHRKPELGLHLPETQQMVLSAIEGLPVTITTGDALSSIVVDLEGNGPGRTVLLRGDMDALPMPEDTGLPFASENPGVMHACGHDSHVAMLVGALKLLAARRDEWQGRVRFMFQPGEEGFNGASIMIDEGVTEGVDAAFALHITPNLPAGWILTKPGALLASSDELEIRVTGRGGHASSPFLSADPIPVACEIVTAIQSAVTRQIDPFDPVIVSVTQINAGTTNNVIPEFATIGGTIRAVSERSRAKIHKAIEQVATKIAEAHGLTADVEITIGYAVTVNEAKSAQAVLDVARDLLGKRASVTAPAPTMGAEDFGYILQKVPGAMAFLGVCPADVADMRDAPACHSNRMMMNEDAMATGVAMHTAMALRFLQGPA